MILGGTRYEFDLKMSKKPFISVVMPVYNAERYLRKAIESILRQSHKGFEFIIIEDCSKDSSLSIIENYAKRDPRILLLRNMENLGVSLSLNKGIERATGDWDRSNGCRRHCI